MARDYAAVIAGLLANAENEGNTDAARQSYRNKAESLMREYRIAEEDALATDPGSASPVLKTMASILINDHLAREWFPSILALVAKHCEVRVHLGRKYLADGSALTPTVIGYEGDVRYFEFLWTASHLMFSTRIAPTWQDTRTEAENVFFLRNAGIQRREIADRAWGNGAGDLAKNRSKIQRVYLAEAKRRGEEARATGLGFDTKTYRDAYANQFFSTLNSRLWQARHAANAAGGAVTLAGRSERVAEAFYGAYPQYRPTTTVSAPYVAPNAGCAACDKAKSGFCREHNWLKPREATQADRARWDRMENSSSARAGMASGAEAARGVVIARGSSETGKMGPAAQKEIG